MAVANLYPVLTVEQAARVETVVAAFGKPYRQRFTEKRKNGVRIVKFYGLGLGATDRALIGSHYLFNRPSRAATETAKKIQRKLAKEGITVFPADDFCGSLKFVTLIDYRKDV